jgi:hypothetical protein
MAKQVIIAHVGHGSVPVIAAIQRLSETGINVVVDNEDEKEIINSGPSPILYKAIEEYIEPSEIKTGQEWRRLKRKQNRLDKFGNKRN